MIPARIAHTGVNMRVNDIWQGEDTIWVCGGTRGQEGFILYSTDQGSSWVNCLTQGERSFYTIERDSAGIFWAGGEFLSIWRSPDGRNWSPLWLGDQVPFHEEDRPAIRQFQFAGGNKVYFAGGENLGEGVLFQSNDGGLNWEFIFKQHEFRDLVLDAEAGIACGHGEILKFGNQLEDSFATQPDNDFYTGIVRWHDGFATCSSQGVILESTDGISWNEWAKTPRLHQSFVFNDISTNGNEVVACGMNGTLWTFSHGSWNAYMVEDRPNLYQLYPAGDGFWAGSDNGTLYYFE
ncbi:MAG: Photosynthesis system assembly factor [Bacteroidota bacterium]